MAVPKAVGVYFTTCLCGIATEKRQPTTYDSQLLIVRYLAGFASQLRVLIITSREVQPPHSPTILNGKYSTGNTLLVYSRRVVLVVYRQWMYQVFMTLVRTERAHRHQGQSACLV